MTDKDSSAAGSKPMTPFVHTRPANNEVHKKVWKIKEYLTAFEPIIQNGRAQPCWSEYRRSFVNEIIPFYENIKNLSQNLDTDIYTEVKEFERSLDKMESDYDKCLADNKRLGDKNKHLLAKTRRLQRVMTDLWNDNERFIADNIAKDICSFVLSSEKQVSPRSNCSCEDLRSACDREHTKVLELEAEVLKQQKMVIESEKPQNVPTEVSADTSDKVSMIAILTDLQTQLDGHAKELSQEQAYWLSANEIASNASNPATPVTPFVHNRPPPKKDICSIVLTSDIVVPPSSNCLCEDLRSACDREHTKVLELEAEVLKQQKMLRKQLQGKDDTIRNLDAQINIMKVLNVGSTVGSFDKQALETELTQLKDAITSVRIQNDGFKAENVNLKRHYEELSKSNAYSRSTFTTKINALTVENAILKTELSGKKSSGSTASEKPKVLASGMYTNSSKYVPPPKRANWVKPTPLPKKKQVTFQEPPRTSNRPTQKPPVQQNKKPNVSVNLSTRTKPATESRKPMPKSHTWNHRILPSKSVNARRAADHNRKLNVVDHNQFAGSKGISDLRHMTGDRARLINFVEKFIGTVRFGNDEYAAIDSFVMEVCDGGLEVAFRQHSCHIRNYDMVDLLKGSRTTNLYSISLNDMMSASPVCLLTKASSTKSWLWHRRLNHLNFGTLNELARNNLVRGLPMLKYDKDHLRC
ncbi:integrase, catalytic region, zinc finger, CCHC-type containing protein [Tanacetum coccineum]